MSAARTARRRRHAALCLLVVTTVLSWKAIESWSQVEQTKSRAETRILLAKEATRQMELLYVASQGGRIPINMPPPPEVREISPAVPGTTTTRDN